jgi:predicted Rossmann fold flavoprotein
VSELPSREYDVIVVGGGAAGLMCAFEAGKRGRKVAVLEHNDAVGRKILISGGGRCNFTNLEATAANYLSGNRDFCKSALARFTPWDMVALVEKHGIRYHEKKLGQQFCDTSSREIVQMLLRECSQAGVEIHTQCRVVETTKPERFRLSTNLGVFEASALVIATGGLSFPKLGASDFGYRVARHFDVKMTPLRPGLVPLVWKPEERDRFALLSGVSLPSVARSATAAFPENLLFTHRGVSGPAVLQISSFWREGETLTFDLMPGIDASAWLRERRSERADVATLLSRQWPKRVAEMWAERYAARKPLAQWNASELAAFAQALNAWSFLPGGTEGYAKAEVTIGGVDTGELSSKTMEARNVPGLFFIGEVVDVTGWLGGYNFQWAWASAVAAARAR